jgi:hypothetical protein
MRDAFAREDCWLRKKNGAASSFIRWMTIVASTYNNGGQEILGVPPPPFNIDFTQSESDKAAATAAAAAEAVSAVSTKVEGTGASASKESGTISHALVSAPSASAWLDTDEPIQGYVYLDSSRSAHDMYGIDVAQGSVVIFRPDSYVAGVVTLEELGTNKVGDWLGPLLGI